MKPSTRLASIVEEVEVPQKTKRTRKKKVE
nr:MAG TPA: hypothetical protein [Caudoviricetes sp.]